VEINEFKLVFPLNDGVAQQKSWEWGFASKVIEKSGCCIFLMQKIPLDLKKNVFSTRNKYIKKIVLTAN